VSHADLLAQIASGVPVDMKVLVVPTPPEIAPRMVCPPSVAQRPARRPGTSSLPRAWRIPSRPSSRAGSMIYTSGTTGRPKGVRRLARYKVPKVVELSASLPREDSGKIFKRKLRASYWEGAGRGI
jgi:acyl-CoA synthetase (AMP-forming)/AMP-acid ligase II